MWHNSTKQSPHTMFHGPARSCSFNSIQTLKLVISQVYCVWFSNTLDVVDLIWFDLIRNPEHLMGLYKSGSIFLLWSCCKDMHEISTIAVTTLQFNNNLILMAWSHRKVYNLPSAVNRVCIGVWGCVCVSKNFTRGSLSLNPLFLFFVQHIAFSTLAVKHNRKQ